jgi:hypothetical protein
MKTLADVMRDGDPLARDPGLSEAEASAIRRRVVSEATGQPARRVAWGGPFAIAAAIAVVIAIGVTAGRRLPPPSVASGAAAVADPVRPAERRQLQFATPGGTRIIWTFDSNFSVKETIP